MSYNSIQFQVSLPRVRTDCRRATSFPFSHFNLQMTVYCFLFPSPYPSTFFTYQLQIPKFSNSNLIGRLQFISNASHSKLISEAQFFTKPLPPWMPYRSQRTSILLSNKSKNSKPLRLIINQNDSQNILKIKHLILQFHYKEQRSDMVK